MELLGSTVAAGVHAHEMGTDKLSTILLHSDNLE